MSLSALRRRRPTSEINVTPFVDVMLLFAQGDNVVKVYMVGGPQGRGMFNSLNTNRLA